MTDWKSITSKLAVNPEARDHQIEDLLGEFDNVAHRLIQLGILPMFLHERLPGIEWDRTA